MSRKKLDKPKAYAWTAYVMTHFPEEVKLFRKYGTPSDELLKLSCKSIEMIRADGTLKSVTFPLSLNTAAGQKLFFEIVERLDLHLKSIPIKAYHLLRHVKTNVTHRRKDTQANLHMVAEAILHRAACEFKTEVLFAFDSINTWIESVYNKKLGYHTLHKALELLQDAGVIRVVEWGVRGNRSKATKIEILPILRKSILTYTSELDDWLMFKDHAMNAVYKRESVARQDVLENDIHSYTDWLIAQEEALEAKFFEGSAASRLFPAMSAKMNTHKVVVEGVKIDNTDRFLGDVVLTLQEISARLGIPESRIRWAPGFGESRCGPARE